jgi:LPXTG-site transpeptidase (sortase) family protein
MTEPEPPATPSEPAPEAASVASTSPRARRHGWASIVHWFGMGCLMLASGIAGYVGWLLWGTGIETAHAQDRLRTGFVAGAVHHPSADAPSVPLGDAYAQILIPEIGLNFMVVQGTGHEALKEGPGHYPDTADPWDDHGRVGIAGHRTTYLHPFFKLNDLRPGDQITLRTEYGTYRYEIDRVFVIPEQGSGRVLTQTDDPTLVLTTCNPVYASYERLIVTATRL